MSEWLINLIAVEQIRSLWTRAAEIWLAGGWAMIGIAIVALVIFAMGLHVLLELRARGFRSVREKTWRRWIAHPDERKGPIGRLLNSVAGARTVEEASVAFEELRQTEVAPFARDLRVMKICVGTAPLLGLLGTVSGMLDTFGALATGAGGEKTMDLIAEGISEALVTTETGLLVAIPGLFFQYHLSRTYERYKAFLAHLESVYTQSLHRRNAKQATGASEMAQAALEY
jgi:biopolymer transport protein ExbB